LSEGLKSSKEARVIFGIELPPSVVSQSDTVGLVISSSWNKRLCTSDNNIHHSTPHGALVAFEYFALIVFDYVLDVLRDRTFYNILDFARGYDELGKRL
jgi:hypothetical protein